MPFVDIFGGIVAINTTLRAKTVVIASSVKRDCFSCGYEAIPAATAEECLIAF